MADTEAPKTVESTVEEKKVEEVEKVKEKVVKDDSKVEENGDKAKNGDEVEKDDEKETEKSEDKEEPTTEKCSIKRKSTAGDAVDGKEESTPEKKSKVDSAPAEVEANGEVTEAEVAA